MRYGLHTTHCRLWSPCRQRPVWTTKLSYQWGYLSIALNPMNGHLIAAFLPDTSQESYQAFLEEVEKEFPESMVLYRDRAGAHLAKTLVVPPTIELREIPPYSPELNPAERFFEALRPRLANRVFESVEALEAAITEILKEYWENPQIVKRLCCFPWIRRGLHKKNRQQNSDN